MAAVVGISKKPHELVLAASEATRGVGGEDKFFVTGSVVICFIRDTSVSQNAHRARLAYTRRGHRRTPLQQAICRSPPMPGGLTRPPSASLSRRALIVLFLLQFIRDSLQTSFRVKQIGTVSYKQLVTVTCHVRFYMFCCIPYHSPVRGCIRHNRIFYRAKATFCSGSATNCPLGLRVLLPVSSSLRPSFQS